jgi:hypothetical protein
LTALVESQIPASAFGLTTSHLYLVAIIAGLAQDLDVVSLWFNRRLYDSDSLFAHRNITHTLVLPAALLGGLWAILGGFPSLPLVALILALHALHIACDVVTESHRAGIPAFFPLVRWRVPYAGRLKWYNHFLIALFTGYTVLWLILRMSGLTKAAVVLSLGVLMVECVYILRSNYRQNSSEWISHQKRWLSEPGFHFVDACLTPFLRPWRSGHAAQ